MRIFLPAVALVLRTLLMLMCIILLAVGFLNLALGGYAAGSVLMALAVAGLVIPVRLRRSHRG